jgi:N-acetylglucosamine repressor
VEGIDRVKQVYGYNLTDVKLHNRFLVYNTIRLHGPIRRASVARKTRLTRATITNIINEFIEEGLVTSSQQGDSSHGYLQINPHAFKICAVHLQGAIAKVAVLTPDMEFWENDTVPLDGSPEEALARVAAAVNSFKEKYDLKVMGVAVSGVVDAGRAFIKHSVTLGWEDVCLVEHLQRLVGIPMVVERNANAPLLAEVWQGSAVGKSNVVYVNYGSGIGCGIMMNGELVARDGLVTGELGHITVDPSGPFCHCGNQGCLEALVSVPALVRQCKAISQRFEHIDDGDVESLFAALYAQIEQGDELALNLLKRTAEYVGLALANMITLFGPEVVVLGNGFVKAGEKFCQMIERAVERRVLKSSLGSFQIVPTAIKSDAILVGISSLAIRHLFNGSTVN